MLFAPYTLLLSVLKKKQEKVSKQLKMYKGQLQIFSLFGQTHHLGLGFSNINFHYQGQEMY